MVCFEVSIYSVCVIFLCALKIHKKLGIMTHVCDLGPGWSEKVDREKSDVQGYPRLLFHCCDKNHNQKQCNQEFVLVYGFTGLDTHTVREGIVVVTGS